MNLGRILRDSVVRFAGKMEDRLIAKDMQRGERGWLGLHPLWLLLRMKEIYSELEQELMTPSSAETVEQKCIDLANYAMFLAEVIVSRYNQRMRTRGVKDGGFEDQ